MGDSLLLLYMHVRFWWLIDQLKSTSIFRGHTAWIRGEIVLVVYVISVVDGSGDLQNMTGRIGSGRVRRCSKSHGSGPVGSRLFEISRVGSRQATRSNPTRAASVAATRDMPCVFVKG